MSQGRGNDSRSVLSESGGLPKKSTYGYCSCNPINKIDPDGALDLYNAEGELVGKSGKRNDRSVLILLDKNDARRAESRYYGPLWRRVLNWVFKWMLFGWLFGFLFGIKDVFSPKGSTPKEEIKGETLSLPSKNVRNEIYSSLEKSNKPTEERPDDPDFERDPIGGFHEEGGIAIKTAKGGSDQV
jgi:hypothetical protein